MTVIRKPAIPDKLVTEIDKLDQLEERMSQRSDIQTLFVIRWHVT